MPLTPTDAGKGLLEIFTDGGSPEESIGTAFERITGQPMPADLEGVRDVSAKAGLSVISTAAGAGVTAAQLAVTLGASASAVPVVGWVVAACALIAGSIIAGLGSASLYREAREAGRKHLRICVELTEQITGDTIRLSPPHDKWGEVPQWDAGQWRTAWWFLRISELIAVSAGTYRTIALYGRVRNSFLLDSALSLFGGTIGSPGVRGDKTELHKRTKGFASIPFYKAVRSSQGGTGFNNDGSGPAVYRLRCSDGVSLNTQQFARGALHLGHAKPLIDWARGGGSKTQRMALAHLGAAQTLQAVINALPANLQKPTIATMILAAQTQWGHFEGVSFLHGVGPAELIRLRRQLPPPPMAAGSWSPYRVEFFQPPGAPVVPVGFRLAQVNALGPWAGAGSGMAVDFLSGRHEFTPGEGGNIAGVTNGKMDLAIFMIPDETPHRRVLIHFGPIERGAVLRFPAPAIILALATKRVPMYGLESANVSDQGIAWLEQTSGDASWAIPSWDASDRQGVGPWRVSPALQSPDLDAGTAEEGGGAGGLLKKAVGLYVAGKVSGVL